MSNHPQQVSSHGGATTPSDYDAGWTRWADMVKYSPAPFHRRRLILQLAHSIPFQSVVDVGCGPGECLQALRSQFAVDRMLGVDLSAGVIEANRRALPFSEFLALDISEAPIPGQWDLVICSEVIEHIADYMKALRHLRAACRGHLIVTVPSGHIFPIDRHMGHYQHFSAAAMTSALRQSAFEPKVVWQWGFPWHTAYKHLINASPDKSLQRFSDGAYSSLDKIIARVVTALFYTNIKRYGSQLIVLAQAVKPQ